jgi:glutamine amidotransferase
VVKRAGIAVVDYGGGNVGSLRAALARAEAPHVFTDDPAVVDLAAAVILPGDGAFGATMEALRVRGLGTALRRAIDAGVPFFGICVGMQVLFERGVEHGAHEGLGVLDGTVERFTEAERVPHMGWNTLDVAGGHPFVEGVTTGDWAYFLHSYRVAASDAAVATCGYGDGFAAIVARDNVMGTQFHPEKSQGAGAQLLRNFLAMVPA